MINSGKLLPMLALLFAGHTVAAERIELPAEFRHARVYVVPETVDGERVAFYTDTGGGANMLARSEAERLGLLPGEAVEMEGETFTLVEFPALRDGRGIPPPRRPFDGRLMVTDEQHFDAQGFLGGRWFAGKVWEFDYPAGTLALLEDWKAPRDAHAVTLGFQVDASGERTMNFPRMTVEIDGEPLDMLLDTGATLSLSESAAKHFDVPAGTPVGGGFITQSTFEKWAKKHPDWLVVDAGDTLQGRAFPMIRVPEVIIAGHAVGPVWFAQRGDKAFREWMTSMMDAPIEGAIGGSAFQYLRMVIDYPGAKAYFFTK